jgi:uncharacterized protein with PIN domain
MLVGRGVILKRKIIGKGKTIFLSPKELRYKLFGKKNCPVCGSKLLQYDRKNYIGVERIGMEGDSWKVDMYDCELFYRCDNCKKDYTIFEISKIYYPN